MPDDRVSEAAHPLPSGSAIPRSPRGNVVTEPPMETVTLGVGSRAPLVDADSVIRLQPRGLLHVPPEVAAEIRLQESKQPLTLEYRKALCDRLTLAHYFADVEVAFRRTPAGIEVLAAGLEEIRAFRTATTAEQRRGVVYGVG